MTQPEFPPGQAAHSFLKKFRQVIGTAFADVGVPSSQVVRAIENIIHGDSGALRAMGEDW